MTAEVEGPGTQGDSPEPPTPARLGVGRYALPTALVVVATLAMWAAWAAAWFHDSVGPAMHLTSDGMLLGTVLGLVYLSAGAWGSLIALTRQLQREERALTWPGIALLFALAFALGASLLALQSPVAARWLVSQGDGLIGHPAMLRYAQALQLEPASVREQLLERLDGRHRTEAFVALANHKQTLEPPKDGEIAGVYWSQGPIVPGAPGLTVLRRSGGDLLTYPVDDDEALDELIVELRRWLALRGYSRLR